MVYIVKYKKPLAANDASDKFPESIFIESDSEPDRKDVIGLIRKFRGNDFVEATIEIEECPDVDADEFRKHSTLYKI